MATEREKLILAKKILPIIGNHSFRNPKTKINGFLAMKGHLYKQGALMVVGRAVNGWTKGIKPSALLDGSRSEEYADVVYKSVTGKGPMNWVIDSWGAEKEKDYNTKRSAFWRVIKAVFHGLNGDSTECLPEWPSNLIWSNLYKVAPERGGNPGSKLCSLQFAGCLELLRLEIITYKPNKLLFLTGNWANPFVKELGFLIQNNPSYKYVEGFGQTGSLEGVNAKLVVAKHPQGKPEGDVVKEILEVI